jgi:hypothetical protein
VVNHFYKLPEKRYEDMFLEGAGELRQLSSKLENQLLICTKQRDRFKVIF